MQNGRGLEDYIRGLSREELERFKRNLPGKLQSMSAPDRDSALAQIRNIPELGDTFALKPTPAPPPTPAREMPSDIPFWQKALDWGRGAVETAYEPFKQAGMAVARPFIETPEMQEAESLRFQEELKRREELSLGERLKATVAPPDVSYLRPGGALRERYEELPIWQQLLAEVPGFVATGGVTAGGIRAALAPAVARGGIKAVAPKVVSKALLPIELGEKALATGLKYGIGLPLKYGVAKPLESGARKSFELALDTGLDKWLLRQGVRGDQANKLVSFFLEKNGRWLYQKAETNWLKRLAEKKGIKVTAQRAAGDTVKEAEPLLLQTSKEIGITPVKDIIKPVTPKPEAMKLLPVGETVEPLIPFPMPGGEVFLEAPRALATNTQKIEAHRIAYSKALISETNKMKPQYRNLAMAMTGKKTMMEMTQEEADIFIDALERLPEPIYRKGELIPPSIPKTKAVVPENFFNLKFKRPTPIKYFTSQNYYSELLGIKPLVEPLELAKQRFDLEHTALRNVITGKIKEIDKLAKTSLAEKAVAKTKNEPTKAISRMRDLLDEYENAPDFLSLSEVKLFSWFRNLNRTMLNGQNEVRQLLGIKEIPYRKAYVRHIADSLAYEILANKYPLPEGLKYWSTQIVGKKIYNPMEMARKLADDLEGYFTKDLEYATRSMVYTALKEIHLSQPLETFTRQLSALSKDLPIYKQLSFEELEAFKKIEVMPATTKRWAIDYINQVIKGQPTGLDEQVNRMFINKGLANVLNFFLRPFGRSLGSMPITKMAQISGRLVISGAMGSLRFKQIIRNKFQNTQNLALYGIKACVRAPFPASGTLKELMDESLFLKGYTGLEELPVDIAGKLEKVWLSGYQWSAITNAMDAMKAAYWDTLNLVIKSKYKKYGWADPQRTYTEPKDFLYPSERVKLLKEMEFGAAATQYQYIGMGMPEVFRSKTLIPFTRLQSWWMNYFFKFHREASTRAFTGQTGYGAKLPWSRRLGWFRYLILGGAILTSMGYSASYLAGVLPSNVAPQAQLVMGVYGFVTARNDWERTKATRHLASAWNVMIPGGLAFKDFYRAFTGEKPWESIFLYGGVFYPEDAEKVEREARAEQRKVIEKIEDEVWSQYPGMRKIYDEIKELEDTDPRKARQMQFQYPQALWARKIIDKQKEQMRKREKQELRQQQMRGE